MSTSTPLLSPQTFHISGIVVDVYGLDELPPSCGSVSCLWLLHGRLQSKEVMAETASTCIRHWNQRTVEPTTKNRGLLCVSFDQRNHGTRQTSALANQAWKQNENHAVDMYGIYHGTAIDTSFLIDHLASYVFSPPDAPTIDQHLVMGVSLGGHAAWQTLFNDPRVTAAVVVIGCPDYMHLMKDRARLSKRQTYIASDGAGFFRSKDFPDTLISSVLKRDPKGLVFGTGEVVLHPSEIEQKHLHNILDTHVRGKRMLLCSGGVDKLVPYRCGEPFLKFLKEANQTWYRDGDFYLEDVVYEGVGHEYTDAMLKDTAKFVTDTLAGSASHGLKTSKI